MRETAPLTISSLRYQHNGFTSNWWRREQRFV